MNYKTAIKKFYLPNKFGIQSFFILAIIFSVTIVSFSQIYPIGSLAHSGDGEEYLKFAKLPFFSQEFWGTYRMPLFPIFIKINNYRVYEIIAIQQLIFIISIIYFSYKVFSRDNKFNVVGLFCSLLVFLTAINPITSFMLHEFMTEALFYSGLIFLLAEIIRLDEKLNYFFIFFAVIWISFLRNEGVILCILLLPAIIYKFTALNFKNSITKVLGLVIILVVAFSYTFFYKHNVSQKYRNAIATNIVLMRVAYDSAMEEHFVKSGMVLDADYKTLTGFGYYEAPKGLSSCFQDEKIPICSWIIKNGPITYLSFFATHPLRLFDPFLIGKSVDRGPLSVYQSDASLADIMDKNFFFRVSHYLDYEKMPSITNIALNIGGFNFFFCLFIIGLSLFALPKKLASRTVFIVSGLFGSAIIVYHADVLEVTRHLTTYALSIRIFTIYLIFKLMNRFLYNSVKNN